jgi:hypothetical protein
MSLEYLIFAKRIFWICEFQSLEALVPRPTLSRAVKIDAARMRSKLPSFFLDTQQRVSIYIPIKQDLTGYFRDSWQSPFKYSLKSRETPM